MKDGTDHLNPVYTNPIEVEVRLDVTMIREDFKIGLDQTTCTEDDQDMDKIIEVGQDMILIREVPMGIIQVVIKSMADWLITIIEGETLGTKIMIEIGVGHMRDRIEIEGLVEVLVTIYQGQVQGKLQIEIASDALSVGNMIILQGTVQLDK